MAVERDECVQRLVHTLDHASVTSAPSALPMTRRRPRRCRACRGGRTGFRSTRRGRTASSPASTCAGRPTRSHPLRIDAIDVRVAVERVVGDEGWIASRVEGTKCVQPVNDSLSTAVSYRSPLVDAREAHLSVRRLVLEVVSGAAGCGELQEVRPTLDHDADEVVVTPVPSLSRRTILTSPVAGLCRSWWFARSG